MKLFVGFFFVALTVAFAIQEECEENATYDDCGSSCYPTCFIYHYPKPCVRMCIPGCYCKTGFVAAKNGSCIIPQDCPRDSSASSIVHNCIDLPEEGTCKDDIAMWYYDQSTDTCRPFYYSGCDGNGNRYASQVECLRNCRKRKFREPKCGENSRYNGCGTPCPITCENYENPPEYCTMMCNPDCHCFEGYVKAENGSCILPHECPIKVEEPNCVDPPEVGPCRAIVFKWFYNQETGTCREFMYGGCRGNGNKYSSEEECLQHCGADNS